MLFNSIEFLLVFLPLAVAGYRLLRHLRADRLATAWLTLLSLGFYGWWNPPYVVLLLGSIAVNYICGQAIHRSPPSRRRFLAALGVSLNLALIGYFKYANFFLETVDRALGSTLQIAPVVLPLAISFFTFQQIAYLLDVDRGHATPYHPLDYTLFVVFFPQLIAGPIVHHQQILPQFQAAPTDNMADYPAPHRHDLAVGLTLFTLGLLKKIWIADPLATIATPLFNTASDGQTLTAIEAWSAALFYSLQLYFDFSGYSDMAIGAARLCSITLPYNFNSPYKATNISDFWRRWHITLSNFLRDYVYIPLGGNRSGNVFWNLLITMLLGGLWHGAGWTFIVWGGLHGLYLAVYRAWRQVEKGLLGNRFKSRLSRNLGNDLNTAAAIVIPALNWGVTFLAVMLGWVVFRADSLAVAGAMLRSMLGQGTTIGQLMPSQGAIALVLLLIVCRAPNVLDVLHRYKPALGFSHDHSPRSPWPTWEPDPKLGLLLGLLLFFALQTLLRAPESEFLYFQF